MSKGADPDDAAAIRRRRLTFRVWHRGMREVDLILGRFADAHVADFSDAELSEFEALLDVPDQMLLAWVLGAEPIPSDRDTPFFRRLLAFQGRGGQ